MKNLIVSTLRLGLLTLLLASSCFAQILETQTDSPGGILNCGTCSSSACSSAQLDTFRIMNEGGTAGSSEVSEIQSSDVTNRMIALFSDATGLGVACDAGTATTRLNVTTGNTNYTVTEICICQGSTEVGSATGLSIALSAGVKTQTVSISSDSGCSSNTVRVIYCGDIGPIGGHGNQTVGITPDQDHDIPATPVAGKLFIITTN